MGRLNKPEKPGYKYRSPGQTNARDRMPNPFEDVVASQGADADRIKRGLDTAKTRPQNRKQVQEAGGRAALRSVGRAGAAELAFRTGYGVGREIDERTGAGKKMVEGSNVLKTVADKMGDSDRAKLSKDSKERIADMENDEAMREIDAEKEGMKHGGKVKKYASGGYVKSADGIAQRGKTKCRVC
jgi:hypothetical protein